MHTREWDRRGHLGLDPVCEHDTYRHMYFSYHNDTRGGEGGKYFFLTSLWICYHIYNKTSRIFPTLWVAHIIDLTRLVDPLFSREVESLWPCINCIHDFHSGHGWGPIYIGILYVLCLCHPLGFPCGVGLSQYGCVIQHVPIFLWGNLYDIWYLSSIWDWLSPGIFWSLTLGLLLVYRWYVQKLPG